MSSSKDESQTDVLTFPVNDSFSVCALSPESLVINSSETAIAMKTKLVDMNDYSSQTLSVNFDSEPKCAKEPRSKLFPLKISVKRRARPQQIK